MIALLIFFFCLITGAFAQAGTFSDDQKDSETVHQTAALTVLDSDTLKNTGDTLISNSELDESDTIKSTPDLSAPLAESKKKSSRRYSGKVSIVDSSLKKVSPGASLFHYVLSPFKLLATSVSDSSLIYEYIAHPTLMIITWPIEKIVAPAFEAALYPIKPPINYVLRENVVERAVDLVSFGKENHLIIYPVLVITTGTGSLTGLTLRNYSVFGRPSESLVMQYQFFVNGSWKLRSGLKMKNLAGSKFTVQTDLMVDRIKDRGFNAPMLEDTTIYYSDSTQGGAINISYPVIEKISLISAFNYRYRKIGDPPLGRKQAVCGEEGSPFLSQASCIEDRGFNQEFQDFSFSIGIDRNTINNPNIPTDGNHLKVEWEYHKTTRDHDFHRWDMLYMKYFFLGVERYEISPKEQKIMGNLNFTKIKKALKYPSIKKHIFNRKVIAAQVRMAQSYEVSKNRTPYYALNAIGNSTPMRGYLSSPFRDWTMGAVSVEYRLPVMRLVEGTIFNEYGMVEKNFGDFADNLVNNKRIISSWGFGARMSRRDIFLFRVQLGFVGWNIVSPAINITVDTAY